MNTNVGVIDYEARISLAKLKADVAEFKKQAQEAGENVGSSIEKGEGRASQALSRLAKFAKVAAITIGTAFTAAVGKFVIGGGISRLLNIEDAQAKLKGLGHDAQSVATIMDSALKSVKGTAFGLDAAATAAASAVAAGIKPGQDLTRVLSLTGDTATIMGREFGEAGAIINKVLASNRLSMEEVNQLSDAGLPILSMLGKEYGKTAAQMREMVSKGEVDSKRFLNALEKNVGGAALASGNTTRGAWKNMQAAMSRVGAAIVKDIIPRVRDAFGSMTKWFDENSDEIVSAVGRTIEVIKNFGAGVIEVGKQVADYLGPKLQVLWNTLNQDLMPILKDLWHNIIEPLIPVVGTTLVGAIGLAIDALNFIIKAFSWLYQELKDGNPVIWGLVGVFGTLATAMAFNAIFNALTVGFTTLRLVTIPSVMTSVGQLRALIASPMVMPAILIGAALAAIQTVYNAGKELQRELSNTVDAIASFGDARASFVASLGRARREGRISNEEYNRRLNAYNAGIPKNAEGTNYWKGGMTWVNERGPELINLPRGSQIIPNDKVDSYLRDEQSSNNISINVNMSGIMARSKSDERDIAKSLVRRINEELTAKGVPAIGGGMI